MIYYLATKAFSNTMRSFLATWGKPLRSKVKVIPYAKVFRQKRFLPGTYIFSDLERLSPRETEWAAAIHGTLAACWADRFTIMNHPTGSMKRYELLRTLYRQGINSHNVYRLTEGRLPRKYPVFIRGADDHGGAGTDLIHTEAELHKTIAAFNQGGVSREDKIIVEYCDTADPNGVYRKYAAFNIAGTIIPRHICFSQNWQVKQPDLATPDLIAEENAFIQNNDHAAELKRIFAVAGIQYGRIDYALHNGNIQVWEINTNPRLASYISAENPDRWKTHDLFVQRLGRAFTALVDGRAADTPKVCNPISKQLWREGLLEHAKYIGESLIFSLPFSPRLSGRLRDRLVALKNQIRTAPP